jgi:hypothetical protein
VRLPITRTPNRRTSAVLLLGVLILATLITGCSGDSEPTDTADDPVFVAPSSADLSTPEASVRSYLEWISYAYRVVDSQVASSVMDPYEWVRVDAYIEKNRQEGRGIDQRLVGFEVLDVTSSESTATVETTEDWAYRYFGPDGAYIGEELTARYSVRYSVLKDAERAEWLVEKVDASPDGEVE